MRQRVGVMLCVGLVGAAVFGAMTLAVSQVQGRRSKQRAKSVSRRRALGEAARRPRRGARRSASISIRDGTSLWVYDRCGGKTCVGSSIAPIQKFDATGRLVVSFGSRHDQLAARPGRRSRRQCLGHRRPGRQRQGPNGHQIQPRRKGADDDRQAGRCRRRPRQASTARPTSWSRLTATSSSPTATASKTNDRIVKFSKDGKFIKAWGHHGSGQGEFNVPHGLAMDSAGRLYVADRANNRIQIFDQDGKFVAEWKQFGRPSGVYHPQRHPLCRRLAIERQGATRRSSKASASAASRTAR